MTARQSSRRWLWLVAVPSALVALTAYRFVFLGLETAFPTLLGQIEAARLAFLLHIVAAPVALAIGALQFFPRLRAARPALHHWMGRAYGVAILVGGLGGLAMAPTASGGPVAAWGFGLLAVLWIVTTAQAVRLAMARRFVEHRRWMARSYALTFAAVTLRLYLPFFLVGGMDYAQASVWLAWISWVPNLLLVEGWMARRDARRTPPEREAYARG